MRTRLAAVLVTTGLIALFGCGPPRSTALVRMQLGEDGNYRVMARDFERDDAEMAANAAAHGYCDEAGRQAIFVAERCAYTGSMDEGTRNTLRRASQAVFATPLANGHGHRSAAVTAGVLGSAVTDSRDYQAEVVFHCE